MLAVLVLLAAPSASAQVKPPAVTLGTPDRPVRIGGAQATRWEYLGATVIRLHGPCRLRSGATVVSADGAIVWLNEKGAGALMAVDFYVEQNVQIIRLGRVQDAPPRLYARMQTRMGVVFGLREIPAVEPPVRLGLYGRALKARHPDRPLPWKPLTAEEKLFRAREFSFVAKTYIVEREEKLVRFILHGDAKVETADATLFADNVIIWTESPEQEEGKETAPEAGRLTGVYAQGSVVFFGPEGSLRADEFYLNTLTEEGIATDAIIRGRQEVTGIPMTFAAKEVQQIDRYTLLAREGYFTTTHFLDPNYRFSARTHRVVHERSRLAFTRRGESEEIAPSGPFASAPPDSMIISGRSNFFQVGPYKIFYLPFLARDFGSGSFLLRTLRFGSDSKFGTFIKTAWNPYDLGFYRNDWSEVTLNLDWYSKRGFGVGADVQYEAPSRFGFLTTYHISDQETAERDGMPVTQRSRGRVLWRHREFLAYDWRADIEFAYRSDRDFLPVFFEQEFEEGKAQETLIYLRKTVDNRAYTALLSARVNDFDTYIERLPELAFRWFDQPFLNDRLLFTDTTTLSYLKLRHDDDLGLTDPDATGRFDTSNEVAMPLDLGGILFEPYVGGDFTLFSNQATSNSPDPRFSGSYGIRMGTNFYRTFPAESAFFDIHGIRHILSPSLNYRHRYYVSEEPDKYIMYDEEIDDRDREHEVALRLRSRWQTKRGLPGQRNSVDFLTMDLDYLTYPGDRGHNKDRDDFLQFNAVWRFSDRLTLFSRDNKFNLSEGQIEVANIGFTYRLWKPIRFTYEHDWVRRAVGQDRSISTIKLSYSPEWSRWQLDLEQRYDLNGEGSDTSDRNDQWLTNIIALSRDLNGWRLIINAEFNQGVRGDAGIGFQLQPTALMGRRVEL